MPVQPVPEYPNLFGHDDLMQTLQGDLAEVRSLRDPAERSTFRGTRPEAQSPPSRRFDGRRFSTAHFSSAAAR